MRECSAKYDDTKILGSVPEGTGTGTSDCANYKLLLGHVVFDDGSDALFKGIFLAHRHLRARPHALHTILMAGRVVSM